MIVSALISQCRRQFYDVAKSTESSRAADGVGTLFNLGRFPVIESSYSVYFDGTAKDETTHYTLDKDSGDLQTVTLQNNGVIIKANYKYATFRDANWVEAINHGIDSLNAKGFFKQVVRNTSLFAVSANVRTYSGPTDGIDVYELLLFSDRTISGTFLKPPGNWSYQQDANKIVLGWKPSIKEKAAISYLRNLKTYTATSATIDVLDDWVEAVKVKAGAYYFRHKASQVATQGAATIDEGHFSFTNIRTMANDLESDFERLTRAKKPTRPAKDIQWHVGGGGIG